MAAKSKKFVTTPPGGVAAYAPPSAGPFKCANCEYFDGKGHCNKPEVVKELGGRNGVADVEAGACCNFFQKRSDADRVNVQHHGGLRIGNARD